MNPIKELRNSLFLGKTFDQNGNENFTSLNQKIKLIEKRIECAVRSAADIKEAILKYDRITPKINVSDFDTILGSADDVIIALNMDDIIPVEDNWYHLFDTYSFESSWGTIICDDEGYILNIDGSEEINGEPNYLFQIERINLEEWKAFLSRNKVKVPDSGDILEVGFFKKDGSYNSPDFSWRNTHYITNVEEIIDKLKSMEVDGETMEYIINEVGMNQQMLRQLVMNNPETDTKDLLEEKISLNEKSR